MKEKTKIQINEIARLIHKEKYPSSQIKEGFDFKNSLNADFHVYWNMALVSYVKIKQQYDLLRYRI